MIDVDQRSAADEEFPEGYVVNFQRRATKSITRKTKVTRRGRAFALPLTEPSLRQ
jgi:hypothetical protein